MLHKCFLRHEPSFFCASLVLSDLINMAAARGAQIQSTHTHTHTKSISVICKRKYLYIFCVFGSVASSLGVVIVVVAAATAAVVVVGGGDGGGGGGGGGGLFVCFLTSVSIGATC